MPYFCRSLISQALNHGAQKAMKGSRILVLGVAYKPDIGDMRESPALKIISLLQNAGADVSYHDPHVPRVRRARSTVASRTSRRLRLRRRSSPTTPSIDYDALVDEAKLVVDLRNATGAKGTRRRARLQAVSRRQRRAGRPRLLGQEPRAELRRARRPPLALRREPELQAEFARALSRTRASPATSTEMLADAELDAVVIATPVPTHYALAKQALEAGKHVFVEKPPAMRAAEMEELVGARRSARARAHAGPPPAVPPRRAEAEGARRLAASSATCSCVYGNRQNLGMIRKDENALWSLGVHDLSVILYLIDEEPARSSAHGNAFLTDGVEDVVFCYLRFPSGKIAHMHLSWLDPHKMRKITVVGRDKMVVFDDMELERKVTVYEKAPEQPSETYGEWRRGPATSSARRSRTTSR